MRVLTEAFGAVILAALVATVSLSSVLTVSGESPQGPRLRMLTGNVGLMAEALPSGGGTIPPSVSPQIQRADHGQVVDGNVGARSSGPASSGLRPLR